MPRLAARLQASPYYPALRHPVLRRVLPGAAASALGDGMSAVAIAWLALKLAPEPTRGLLVGAAVAAYSLPGQPARRYCAAGSLARRLAGRGGARLASVNAVLRAAALGLIACLALIIAAPVGTALGGPIVAALGARGTLLASALATVALALITAAILALPRSRPLLSRGPEREGHGPFGRTSCIGGMTAPSGSAGATPGDAVQLAPGVGPEPGASSGNSRATTATGAASAGRAAGLSSRCRYWAISARITSAIPAISSGVK